MSIEKKKWTDVSDDAISVDAIRNLHSPDKFYRFTKDGYPSGAHFAGCMAVTIAIFVLGGAIKYTIEGVEISLKAGEFAKFAPCSYECDVDGEEGVQFVRVSYLPDELTRKLAI